jgi:hypothetical protein
MDRAAPPAVGSNGREPFGWDLMGAGEVSMDMGSDWARLGENPRAREERLVLMGPLNDESATVMQDI